MNKIKEWKVEELSAEQRRVYDDIINGPRGNVIGPFKVWLNNPNLAKHAQSLGAYLRFESNLPESLSELSIITTGRCWSSEFEWEQHAPLALNAGVKLKYIQQIANAVRPIFNDERLQIVFDFSAQLNILKLVSDDIYKRALDVLGTKCVIDIVAICGYYSLVSMTLNVFKFKSNTNDWPLPKVENLNKMLLKV